MRSRVIPGSSPTMERRECVRRLKRVDLPTLGRPTIATSGKRELAGVEGTTDLWYLDKGNLQLPFVQALLLRNLRARGIDYPCIFYCLLEQKQESRDLSRFCAVG